MNRYLLLSAAGLLACTSGAAAAKKEFAYCGLNLFEPQKGVFAVQYPDGSTGQGLTRKTPQGRFLELSNNYYGNYTSIALSYDLSLPFQAGGTLTAWIEFSGTTSFEGGTSTCNGAGQRDRALLLGKVRELIAARRAARVTR